MVLFGYVVGHEGDHSQLGITGFVHAPDDKSLGFFPVHRVSASSFFLMPTYHKYIWLAIRKYGSCNIKFGSSHDSNMSQIKRGGKIWT